MTKTHRKAPQNSPINDGILKPMADTPVSYDPKPRKVCTEGISQVPFIPLDVRKPQFAHLAGRGRSFATVGDRSTDTKNPA